MVLAKNDKCERDLEKEPITPFYDTETGQIKADGTSLGGDDGVGVAAQLAIMHNPSIIHGPLEHLFTVNEEDNPGKCVVEDMEVGALDAKYYINLDGEELDALTFGGAGCSTLKYDCPFQEQNNPGRDAYNVSLTGVTGGHC